MWRHCLKSLTLVLFIGLMFTFIVQAEKINKMEAMFTSIVQAEKINKMEAMFTSIVQAEKINKMEAKSKGINVVKDEVSYLSIALDQKKRQKLYKQYRSATTEAKKAFYLEQMQDYDNKLQEWYKSISDPEKEKEVREKQELLEDALRKESSTEKNKENLKKIPTFTRIGYDMINHSLEVALDPAHFSDKEIKESIKYIRKIIGDEIDLTISQAPYAKHPVEHRK